MRTCLLVTTLTLMLIGAIVAAYQGWFGLGDVDIGLHGMLALALGSVLSLAVGIGLMSLVFYSSRSGRDEIADWRPDKFEKRNDDPTD